MFYYGADVSSFVRCDPMWSDAVRCSLMRSDAVISHTDLTASGIGLPTFDFSIMGHRRKTEGPKAFGPGPNEAREARSAEGGWGLGRGVVAPPQTPAWRSGSSAPGGQGAMPPEDGGSAPGNFFEISVAKSCIRIHFAHFCV